MSMLTDKEQIDLLSEEPGPITEKVIAISKREAALATERVLRELRPFVQKVDSQEQKIDEHENFITTIRRGFSGIVKATK